MDNSKSTEHPLKRYHDEDWHTPKGRLIREVVFGINDGLVTTVGFVAGITGALNNTRLILISATAELVAGAISMFFGAYLSTKSQNEFFKNEMEREKREIEEMPDKERDEIRDIYGELGFSTPEIEMIVNRVTSNKNLWIRFMMREELGIMDDQFDGPINTGALMGVSFVIGALPPILPYIFIDVPILALKLSIVSSLLFLFLIGLIKTKITNANKLKSGFESVIIGSLAASIGYLIGSIVNQWLKDRGTL